MMGEDYFNHSEVEYHTFEYDSKDTTGIEDYVIKNSVQKVTLLVVDQQLLMYIKLMI